MSPSAAGAHLHQHHHHLEGLVDYLIIDSTWAGGLTTWRKAAVMAGIYQIPLAAHHDPQVHVHTQAASPTGFILEFFADPVRDLLWFDLFSERLEIVDGFMALPEMPGLGVELRGDTLEIRRQNFLRSTLEPGFTTAYKEPFGDQWWACT